MSTGLSPGRSGALASVGMEPLDVDPAALRRCGGDLDAAADALRGDLTATVHATAPDHPTGQGWALTPAVEATTRQLDASLAALVSRLRTASDGLRTAADDYERADDRAAGRLRW